MSDVDAEEFAPLAEVFREQLIACLEECARGRRGLFSDVSYAGGEPWPEAEQLRQLAAGLAAILNQDGESNALVDEFLDLCTMHGESHPGESRLAREFLKRIERGEVGMQGENQRNLG
ncbi:MAG TPA: hypothetical protein VF742_02580 [Terracidiphilus sp.]